MLVHGPIVKDHGLPILHALAALVAIQKHYDKDLYPSVAKEG
jgi:hypothetical protein